MLTVKQKEKLTEQIYRLLKEEVEEYGANFFGGQSMTSEKKSKKHSNEDDDEKNDKHHGHQNKFTKKQDDDNLKKHKTHYHSSSDKNNDGKSDSDMNIKRDEVMKWLDSEQIKHSTLSYELYPELAADGEEGKSEARSIFTKKEQGHDSNGNSYEFSAKEINDLFNMKDREMEKYN